MAESKPDSSEKFVARLRAIGEAAYHDKHPFHVLMHQGKLTRRQLQAWIENRFYYQWTIPKKDALILAKADDPEFRRAWITRITDHDGIDDREGGIRKWYKLSEAAGLDVADVASLRYVLPGVRFAVDAYLHLCASRPLTDAVASALFGWADRFRQGANVFGDQSTALSKDAARYGNAALTRISDQTEQRPLIGLAVAFGVGVLIGMAARGRH